MEYTEVFYARQPGVAELGIPNNLVAPKPLSAQSNRTEEQATRIEQQHMPQQQQQHMPQQQQQQHMPQQQQQQQQQQLHPLVPAAAAIGTPAKASYPLIRLPSEEELASSLANQGGGG
ncbi:hypothetical protein Emed_005252 [Eimeria media]